MKFFSSSAVVLPLFLLVLLLLALLTHVVVAEDEVVSTVSWVDCYNLNYQNLPHNNAKCTHNANGVTKCPASKNDDAGANEVTNKAKCEKWCGGDDAHFQVHDNGYYNDEGNYVSGQFTGLECTCTTPGGTEPTTNEENSISKHCKGTYIVPACFEVGVGDDRTCNQWCGGMIGTFSSESQCECTDKNNSPNNPEPVTKYCIVEVPKESSGATARAWFGGISLSIVVSGIVGSCWI